MRKTLTIVLFLVLSLVAHAQYGGIGGSSSGSRTATFENVYAAPGSFTFAHNLSAFFPQVTCYTRTGGTYGSASWTASAIDANNTSITVPSAGDYICAFSATAGLFPDFLVATSPTTVIFQPTMTGTQQPTFTVNQTAVSGYTGTATYTVSGLASGMTGAYSPTTITGTGSNVLTLSFPANQAAATTPFTVTGTDGSKIHTASPSITVGNINSGLVECWAMTDGSGSAFADSCGTSNTETLVTGTLTWATNTGLPGSTATFSATAYANGINQTATNFTGTAAFSVSTWANLAGTASARTFASTLDFGSSDVGWEFSTLNSGAQYELAGYVVNNISTNAAIATTSTLFSGSALHYLVMTYDGSQTAAGIKFYIDGVLATNNAPTQNNLSASAANTKPVTLGGRTNGTDPLNGIQAYVRIYNRALSQADITNYYAAGAR